MRKTKLVVLSASILIVAFVSFLGVRHFYSPASVQSVPSEPRPEARSKGIAAIPDKHSSLDLSKAATPNAPKSAVSSPTSEQPFVPGEKVEAKITLTGQEKALSLNEAGNFTRVFLEPSQKVPVRVSYPNGQPGDPVIVQVEDGGRLDSGQSSISRPLDAKRTLAFQFNADSQPGLYQIVLRYGEDVKNLQFWVGPDFEYATQ